MRGWGEVGKGEGGGRPGEERGGRGAATGHGRLNKMKSTCGNGSIINKRNKKHLRRRVTDE